MRHLVNTNWLSVNHSNLMSRPDSFGTLHHSPVTHCQKISWNRFFKLTSSYLHDICSGCRLPGLSRGFQQAGASGRRVYSSALGGWLVWPWGHVAQTIEQRKSRRWGRPSFDVPCEPHKAWSVAPSPLVLRSLMCLFGKELQNWGVERCSKACGGGPLDGEVEERQIQDNQW